MCVKAFLLCFICILCGDDVIMADNRLRIIHTNDFSANIAQTSRNSKKCSVSASIENKCYGGIPRLITAAKAEIKRAKDDGVPIVFLYAGDSLEGTVWYSFYKSNLIADFIKRLHLDAMGLGTHDFDEGTKNLSDFIKNISSPALICNMDASEEPDLQNNPLLKPSIVINRGDLKIGLVGYITPTVETLSRTGKIKFSNEIESIKAEARKLKADGVNIIIGLGHSGYQKDIEIAQAVTDLDVIVGGHSHTFLYSGVQPDIEKPVGPYPTWVTQSSDRSVIVLQAYAYTKYLGSIEVAFDGNGELIRAVGQPILLKPEIEQDPSALEEVKKWETDMNAKLLKILGNSTVFLNGTCRFHECNFGNLITDAALDHAVRTSLERGWSGAGIAIYQSGAIRASIVNGKITKENVITAMPYFSPIYICEIKGKYLQEALEWSVARYDQKMIIGRGEFLQVSGLHVVFDLRKSSWSRVVQVTVQCSHCMVPNYYPLDPEELYKVVLPEFIGNGGDNFTMFANHRTVIQEFNTTDTDIVADFILRKQMVYYGVEERIRLISLASKLSIKPIFLILCAIYHCNQ